MKMPAWSYSSLTAFETCPKRYFHIKVAKDVVEEKGEAADWGSTVHKHLEDRIKDGTPLPPALVNYEVLVAPIASSPGEKVVEKQMAVTSDFRPTGWFSDDAWCRGIVDVGVLTRNQKAAVLLDWKTGKRKPDSSQLKLFAALAFSHYPELQIAHTGFVWLKTGQMDKDTHIRENTPILWQEFVPRVMRMTRAFENNTFPPKPSGLCKKYCPVPKRTCEFSGKQ